MQKFLGLIVINVKRVLGVFLYLLVRMYFAVKACDGGGNSRIFHVAPYFRIGDAIGNEITLFRKFTEKMGYNSYVCASRKEKKSLKDIESIIFLLRNIKKDDMIIYHFASGSLTHFIVKAIDVKSKVIRYHGVTPAKFFIGKNLNSYCGALLGELQLGWLSGNFNYAWATSDYTRQDLVKSSYKNISVVPFVMDFSEYEEAADKIKHSLSKDKKKTTLLFVGRVVEHKKQEDVIKSFYFYKKYFNNESKLLIVGSLDAYYHEKLLLLADKLELGEKVVFTGKVSFEELVRYYLSADVFLCMSEHEGFCVPLIESMLFGLPIIAYAAAAVPDTLADAGEKVYEKEYYDIAQVIDKLVNDVGYREKILEAQSKRLGELHSNNAYQILRNNIGQCLSTLSV